MSNFSGCTNDLHVSDIPSTVERQKSLYPSWNDDAPLTENEIQSILTGLQRAFQFQKDNVSNIYDYLMSMLDSRASRMGPMEALNSLYQDYVGVRGSNFMKWYASSRIDVIGGAKDKELYGDAKPGWARSTTPSDLVLQVSLYLLCWGEANHVRFMPECLCFIFKVCCDYYYYSYCHDMKTGRVPWAGKRPLPFLDHVITPLYNFHKSQQCSSNGDVANLKDHSKVIGYDDINQFFWHREDLDRLKLQNNTLLNTIPIEQHYLFLNQIDWSRCFYKTYYESRTWFHVVTNFNRIWIIHLSVFWYYTTFNSKPIYTQYYDQTIDNQPTIQCTLSALSIAGVIATLVNLFATIGELLFVPRKFPGALTLTLGRRIFILMGILLLNLSPSIYIFGVHPWNTVTKIGLTLAVCQFVLSLVTVAYFSVVPLQHLFSRSNGEEQSPEQFFVNFIVPLQRRNHLASVFFWTLVFVSKFVESYFFLTLSLKDPIRELSSIASKHCDMDSFVGGMVCQFQPKVLLAMMILTDAVLFFLDTYLWYIIFSTFFSTARSFYLGISIWTPWRNVFSKLPKRIFSKIIFSNQCHHYSCGQQQVAKVWNEIIWSMYREHLISDEHVQKLVYHQIATPDQTNGCMVKEPAFLHFQEEHFFKSSLFHSHRSAKRRITFFARSLVCPMPETSSVENMPVFTVLIPHYNEKILLSIREIVKEEDEYSHVTLLEYLKSLYQNEWMCFVAETRRLAEESFEENSKEDLASSTSPSLPTIVGDKPSTLSYSFAGFKTATSDFTLRTRMWTSLRTQTLFRTVSGFMNYSKAISLLHSVEKSPKHSIQKGCEHTPESADFVALRKFRMVVSMQRMNSFGKEDIENRDHLLRLYPHLQIAYIDEEYDPDSGKKTYYSALIDGHCEILESGQRKPRYRIRLSGNPILGDGKSDNQNHAIIFGRGEYIQLVDANQDNYLEECLKIKSVLKEFEYDSNFSPTDVEGSHSPPVAIVGTREYIFSEKIGVLGDIAAGKEQVFGTLFARTLSYLGGKLHYGHPDFLNVAFLTTRGGVSKAQKGLHLNEDIYTGMDSVMRGGIIKHCEYNQCGKGRDLGFGSILNFTTKIGAGMGEQLLSREYYYFGTLLPLDRFLTFYYTHPGFHLNNVLIMFSIKLFIIFMVNLAVLIHESVLCQYNSQLEIIEPRIPMGCVNLISVVFWLRRSILSILAVSSISFFPLFVQELSDSGARKAVTRIVKHFFSLAPIFEVFVCKVFAGSLVNDLLYGGARYISTGRTYSTVRVPFASLYSRFAPETFYFSTSFILLLLYSSMVIWDPSFLYFWFTIVSLLISPFIFNPNQFMWSDFLVDYREYLRWLFRIDTNPNNLAWKGFVRGFGTDATGKKTRRLLKFGNRLNSDLKRPTLQGRLFSDVLPDFLFTILVLIPFLFLGYQGQNPSHEFSNPLIRVAIVSILPIACNSVMLLALFVVSIITRPLTKKTSPNASAVFSTVAHLFGVFTHVLSFELLWALENWDLKITLLGFSLSVSVQGLLFKFIYGCFLSEDPTCKKLNRAWWSGGWLAENLGWHIFVKPLREYVCKIIEMSLFAGDFTLGHFLLFLQTPMILISPIDKLHSMMLFWKYPSSQVRPVLFSRKKKRERNAIIRLYSAVYVMVLSLFVCAFATPFIVENGLKIRIRDHVPNKLALLFHPEPNIADYMARGLRGYKSRMENIRESH